MHKIFNILKKEINLAFKDKIIPFSMLIILIYSIYGLLDTTSSNNMQLILLRRTSLTISLSSANMAAILSSVLFAICTYFTVSRDKRKKSYALINSSFNSVYLFIIRVCVLIFYAIVTVLLIFIISFLLQTLILKTPFEPGIYLFSYTFITLFAMIFSILLSSGLYLISESMDIVFITFALLFFISVISQNYLLNWINFPYSIYSDFAGIRPITKFIIYSRLFQFCLFLTIFILGLLFRRKYEFSAFKSLSLNIKKFNIPVLFLILIITTSFIYIKEPYLENKVDFFKNYFKDKNINKNITLIETYPKTMIDSNNEKINCDVLYLFNKNEDDTFIDFEGNIGLNVKSITVNNANTSYISLDNGKIIRVSIPKGKKVAVSIKYEGKLKFQAPSGFAGYLCKDSAYLLENSKCIFQPQTNIYKKMKVKGYVKAPLNWTVATVGKLDSVKEDNPYKIWNYSTESSELNIGIFAANYKIDKFTVDNVDVELYYSPKHEKYIKEANIKKQISNILSFYIDIYGDYPFKDYPFKVVETSMYKGGGHSTQNVVTIAEYMFNRRYNANPEYIHVFIHDMEILAHEISHQWWGGSVNINNSKASITEGLANYSSYLYVNKAFGEMPSRSILYSWNRATQNPNKKYITKKNIKESLSQENKYNIELSDIVNDSYYKIPLELLKIQEKNKCSINKNLSKIYKKYKSNSLTYNQFLKEMNIDRGDFKID